MSVAKLSLALTLAALSRTAGGQLPVVIDDAARVSPHEDSELACQLDSSDHMRLVLKLVPERIVISTLSRVVRQALQSDRRHKDATFGMYMAEVETTNAGIKLVYVYVCGQIKVPGELNAVLRHRRRVGTEPLPWSVTE